MNYTLPTQNNHRGLLEKIQNLNGQLLKGRDAIKGPDGKGFPPDKFVSQIHFLHDLIRGFYKPKGLQYILSYQSTGEYKGKNGPIYWANSEHTEFDYIEMWPPNKPKDTRKKSDIDAARNNLKDGIPIGIFEKTNKGQNKCLGLGVITEERSDGCFIVKPVNVNFKNTTILNIKYFTFKTNLNSIEGFATKNLNEFEFNKINWYCSEIQKGDIVFFVQRGDRPSWNPGLSAICEITQGPYDLGYDPSNSRNFKVKIKPKFLLPKVLDRKDFVGDFDCYDLTHIGPMTKNEPNQAISMMSKEQAISLCIAICKKDSSLCKDIENATLLNFINHRDLLHEGVKPQINIDRPGREGIGNEYQLKNVNKNSIEGLPFNLIIYGAPGTGKSFELNKRAISHFPDVNLRTRITFHPNYSHKNFIGSYKPSPLYKSTQNDVFDSMYSYETLTNGKEPMIDYVFEPGPFIQSFLKAHHNPDHNFVLIIEELNRANAPAVFGELFQLLDREADGRSTYSVRLEEATMKYLRDNDVDDEEIRMPKNLYIWATMNNADQGVMPLDAAFKRRWEFERLGLNENQGEVATWEIKFAFIPSNKKLMWNRFREKLNDHLTDQMSVQEDKLIAPFFINERQLSDPNSINNKLILYLKEDVLRYKNGLFEKNTFTKICEQISHQENGASAIIGFDITELYEDRTQ
jgi:5-methylcytosine-specific restriction protein B